MFKTNTQTNTIINTFKLSKVYLKYKLVQKKNMHTTINTS